MSPTPILSTAIPADFAAAAGGQLRALTADPQASFRPGQLEAIHDVVVDHARVLCVQRTGWGKSAVYFVATALLRRPTRETRSGPTLIVSPLLALMRNQITAAGRLGLRAHTINSTNRGEWDGVAEQLAADELDLLLISPERLNNPRFVAEMLPLFAGSVGLLVIDEAHCISDWGHDFRPDYRRVRDMLERLPAGVAVLGTTATANDRVVADVTEQMAAGATAGGGGGVAAGEGGAAAGEGDATAGGGAGRAGARLRTYRGPLSRDSLRLEVVSLPRPAERLAWLAEHVPALAGSGIVYTLTRRDAEQVAAFLSARGITAVAYSGDGEPEERESIEQRLLTNQVKAVVATSALGMGYDKPDLAWVVHYQAPGSVIAYYQQIGRAGRAVDHADVVLLRGGEDRRIQDFFIEQSFPSRERVKAVLDQLAAAGPAGHSTPELMAAVNLGRGRLEAMLKILDVEGAVRRDGTRWISMPGCDWSYDGERYARITALRRAEQAAMASFGADGRCLMRTLREQLDDPGPEDCGRCAVCTAPRFAAPPDPALVELGQRHLRAAPVELEAKKMAPGPDGRMRKIPEDARIEPGWALARFGDGGWWPAVARLLAGQAGGEEVVAGLNELMSRVTLAPDWVTVVPSRHAGQVLTDLAGRLAEAGGIRRLELVARVDERPPQSEMANAVQQAANVRGAFRVLSPPPPGTGLLLDDRRGSGWTLAMVGGQLRRAGAERVVPLVLASAF